MRAAGHSNMRAAANATIASSKFMSRTPTIPRRQFRLSTRFLDVKRVTDASGRTLKYESSRERHYRKLKIYVPDADNSTQTISIEYSVSRRKAGNRCERPDTQI